MANILQCTSDFFNNAGAAPSEQLAFVQTTSAGSLLFCVVAWETTGGITITSVAGTSDTYTAVGPALTATGTSHQAQAFYCLSGAGGASTVKVSFSGAGGTFVAMSIVEYGFVVSSLAQTAQTTANSTTPNSGAVVATGFRNIAVGYAAAGSSGIFVAGTGFNWRGLSNAVGFVSWSALEDQIVGPGSIAANFTTSPAAAWVCGIAVFPLVPAASSQSISF